MDSELIKEAVTSDGIATVTHENGRIYYLDNLLKMQVNGEWIEACSYHCVYPVGRFCRALTDFKKFTYLHNDVINMLGTNECVILDN